MFDRRENVVKSSALPREFQLLADDLGLLTEYEDAKHVIQHANHDALLAMFRALGAPATSEREARDVRSAREAARVAQGASEVVVAWGGVLEVVEVFCARDALGGTWQARVALEDGRALRCAGSLRDAHTLALANGQSAARVALPVNLRMPLGQHRLELEWPGHARTLTVIAAPRKAPRGPRRAFGVFAPVHALRGESQLGTGTLRELGTLMDVMRAQGGEFVATLPMMAQFLDEPYDTSPFAPASRLFWNELYLDLAALHDVRECPETRALLESPPFLRELAELEAGSFVKPRRQIELVHAVLEPLARWFFTRGGEQTESFRAFLAEQPYAREYAIYRSILDAHTKRGAGVPDLRGRTLRAEDGDEGRRALHLFAQYQMHVQLAALTERTRATGMRLYLDLPVGVHPASFDVHREPDCFVHGATVGAPPDALCPEGQNWGFSPNHPEGQRAQGYRYFTAYARAQLRHAGILRLDHVMGFTRIFCIPEGMAAKDGMYLRQPQEELYAILALEASRHGSVLVGEDLGVVPDGVRAAMHEHGMKRMYVLPFEIARDDEGEARAAPVPSEALAALNTHDMPTFAGLWRAHDIDERVARGVLSSADALQERLERHELLRSLLSALGLPDDASRDEALHSALRKLGESQAELVVVALEDLWGEVEPQNVPGTFDPDRNFCRRMRYRVDQLGRLGAARGLLRALSQAREAEVTSFSSHPA